MKLHWGHFVSIIFISPTVYLAMYWGLEIWQTILIFFLVSFGIMVQTSWEELW